MAELTLRMADIRRKAEASEAMVQEICRDIRKLDRAKGHLQITITSLRRLAMLVDAVGMFLCDMCMLWLMCASIRVSMGKTSNSSHPASNDWVLPQAYEELA